MGSQLAFEVGMSATGTHLTSAILEEGAPAIAAIAAMRQVFFFYVNGVNGCQRMSRASRAR